MPFIVEKLHVYQRAVDFADRVLAATERFPRGYGCLADQLNRAAISISANLAEGNGRFTKPDRRNFFGIARGSTIECVPLLELARRRGLVDGDHHVELQRQLEEIARMLSGLIAGLENRRPSQVVLPRGGRATAAARPPESFDRTADIGQ